MPTDYAYCHVYYTVNQPSHTQVLEGNDSAQFSIFTHSQWLLKGSLISIT